MAKYKVLEEISRSQGKNIQPGAVIEIEDQNVAAILLEKGVIKPASHAMKYHAIEAGKPAQTRITRAGKSTFLKPPEADEETTE